MAKYGMSECTLGHAGEFRPLGIGVNSLWPRTAIATAALQMIPGVDVGRCRTPEILADAAYFILTSDAKRPAATSSSTTSCSPRTASPISSSTRSTPGTKDFIPDFFVD